MKQLEQRIARLEREHEITIIRMGQMQEAFDIIFSAWQDVVRSTDATSVTKRLFAAWETAAKRMALSARGRAAMSTTGDD
jgi:hypothetical protein